jgi:hypothetical protein
MAKIGKATMDEPRAQDPTAAAARQREDLKRAIEAGVLGPLRAAQEGVDPSIDKPEKKDAPDLDLGMPVDVPAQEDARSWEEALVKMKKQKAQRAAKPKKPKATPGMERFIKSLLSDEGVERSQLAEGAESRREVMEQVMDMEETDGGIKYDYSDVLDLMRAPRMLELMTEPSPWHHSGRQSTSKVSEDGLQLRGDLGIDGDDPQAIADAADDRAAQYIYEDILPEDVPDAAALSYEREIDNDHRAVTYEGDGPGGEGTVYFYEMSGSGGGGQQGYWVRDDGSVVNVTNILSPPDA